MAKRLVRVVVVVAVARDDEVTDAMMTVMVLWLRQDASDPDGVASS